MRFNFTTLYDVQIREANLMLRIFKRYVDAHDYNGSSTELQNRLFWNYYRLRENIEKKDFWKSSCGTLSANEICMEVLVEFYVQLKSVLTLTLTSGEERLLDKIINRFYENLKLIPSTSASTYSNPNFHLGYMEFNG